VTVTPPGVIFCDVFVNCMSDDSDDLRFTYQRDEGESPGVTGKPEVDSPAIQTGYNFSMEDVPDEIKGRDKSYIGYLIGGFSLLLLIGAVLVTVYIILPEDIGSIPLNPIEFVQWAIDTISRILIEKLESAFAH